jgi:hypothetical protein
VASFPQPGGCLCGDVRYRLVEDPLTVYACHCSDCQRQTGTSFALSMIARLGALEATRGEPREVSVRLADGRVKRSLFCARCCTRLWALSRVAGLAVVEPGTLDDTRWFAPVGHIWTRSAQPWFPLPEDALQCERGPDDAMTLALVRAWKARGGESGLPPAREL